MKIRKRKKKNRMIRRRKEECKDQEKKGRI